MSGTFHRELSASARSGLLGETLAHAGGNDLQERSMAVGSAGFHQPLQAGARRKARELELQAVDPGEVAAGIVIPAFMVGSEVKAASGEGVARSCPAKVDQSGEVLFLLSGDSGISPGADCRGDLTVEQRGSQFDGMARNNARVETVEPAGMNLVPRAVLDHHMVVDAVAFCLSKCAIGQLEHPDCAGSWPVPVEGVPG
ncbi:MAG: hypothetical protein LZF60_380071 [Nitrospira sp.]|nr:MAG: hypothetical protein LZF60_380071 [Nitrospira sp.]